MIPTLLVLLVGSVAWLVGASVWSIVLPERRIWPPRIRHGVAYRLNAILGPGINFLLAALSFLGWNTMGLPIWLRSGLGAPSFLLGAYLSLGGVYSLGAPRTQGYQGELEETGPYRISRNPQYTGAILSFGGLAILCDSEPGLLGVFLSSTWFALLPFVEEPWLREKLGAPYVAYTKRVPRYLSLRALLGGSHVRGDAERTGP